MKIELFTLSDFAADYGGKLSVVGVFDTLFARQAPVVHPAWSIAVKIRFEKIEEGKKKIRLSISDADGKTVLPPLEMSVDANTPPNQHTGTFQIVANIGGVKFDQFGEYSIDLAIDGRHEASIPLFVRQIHNAPA
jgi:hypothetical protein